MTLQELTLTMLQSLTPHEERLLRSCFGFDGAIAATVPAQGYDQSITRESVDKIEDQSLRKLRRAIAPCPV